MNSRIPIHASTPPLTSPVGSHGQGGPQHAAPVHSGRGTRHLQQKQKRIACSACRQAKLKCDWGTHSGQASCSRCRRLSLECRQDSNYKRVHKRNKLDELAEQVERLSSAVGGNGGNHESATNPVSTDDQTIYAERGLHPYPTGTFPLNHTGQPSTVENAEASTSSKNDTAFPFSGQQEMRGFLASAQSHPFLGNRTQELFFNSTSSRSLEHIELNSQQINHFFYQFFENYHHFMEILDPSLSPDQYYMRSPLLFWCIISVAASRYEEDSALQSILSPCVTRLLWNTISVRPHNRFAIFALLLLSIWPFPTNTMASNPCLMLVSLAQTAAMQLGLHRPETVQDFLRVKTTFGPQEFQEAVKIWAGCYIATQMVTTIEGQPSNFSFDWALDQACEIGNKYTVPENLRCHLLIHKYIGKVNTVMSGNHRSPTGYPSDTESCVLMKMLEGDLADLESQIKQRITAVHSILLSIACLQLRTYYFFMPPGTDFRKQGLLGAYAESIALIGKLSDVDIKWNFISFAPIGYVNMLVNAAMVLIKIANSNYSAYIDVEAAKISFNTANSLLKKASVEDNDLRGRSSKIIGQLWSLHHTLNLRKKEEPTIHIKTRWGASLIHDSLWIWREEFGGQKAPLPPSSTAATTSLSSIEPLATGMAIDIDPRPTATGPDEGWIPPTNIPDQQPIESDTLTNFGGLPENSAATDWIWDIDFPSIMPFDINSYQMLDVDQMLGDDQNLGF